MILSSKTKEKIMNVRDFYDKKEKILDIEFIKEILTIIQKEEAFKETLQYEFVKERKKGPAYVEEGIAYFHIDLFMKYIKRNADSWFCNYPKKDKIKYYNLVGQLVLLHECAHTYQQNGLEGYAEINRLYKDLCCERYFSSKEIMKKIRLEINLLRINAHACYERKANIDAFRELVEMYGKYAFLDFLKVQHIYNLSFKPKRESIVHDTLHLHLLEYNYNCDGIPKDMLFETGLPTDKKYSEAIYDAIDKYYEDKLSYENVLEKIKKY